MNGCDEKLICFAAKQVWFVSGNRGQCCTTSCTIPFPTLSQLSSYAQTDATTPNIVGPTILRVTAPLLAVVCKRMQQLPTIVPLQCIVGRIQPIMRVRGPNNVWRAVQMDPSCCATLLWSRNNRNVGSSSCFKSLTGFKLCATTPNKTQQHVTTCSRMCKRTHHVTSNNVAPVCTGLGESASHKLVK